MKRHWLYPAVTFLLLILVFPASLARGSPVAGKIEPALLGRFAAAGRADFVVRFAEQSDLSPAFAMNWHDRGWFVYDALRATASRSQERAIDALKGRRLDYRTFIAGNELYVYAGDLAIASALAALPEVSAIAATRTYYVEPLLQQAVPAQPEALTWGVIDVKADQFWSTFGLQGDGIVVASIDTGVAYQHPALDQAYKCAANPADPACWYDPANICGGTPCDNVPHGTPTLGPILADDDLSLPYQAGVAPNAQWIACKGCESVSCSVESLNACADWVLAPAGDPDNRPHVVYNGWGGQGCNDWFLGKSQAWLAAGLFATFSPGGQGPSCTTMGSPGDYQESFAGTAHGSSRNSAPFASRGPSCYGHDPYTKPNISAPGVTMCVPVPPDGWNCGYSGTSFSSAYPAGAVALLWSCAPSLVGEVYPTFEALQDTADAPPAGNCGAPPDGEGNYTFGYGYLNVLAAGQAYCGPPTEGLLAGHVYDAVTGDPLSGATVTAVPGPVQSSTDPNGYYTMTLDAGIYTVTAAMLPYASQTVSGVVITTGLTTTQDFSLTLQPLVPSFESSSPVCLRQPMAFTDTSAGNPTAWRWDFGDGVGTSSEQNPVYTYTAAGTFTVTLWVTNAGGMSWTTGLAVAFPLAVASFDHDPPAGPLPLTVYFTSTSDDAISPTWDFGDGGIGAGERVSHTYDTVGTFTVTLTVDSPYGCGRSAATGVVEVWQVGPPTAAFSADPPAGCVPLTVQFIDQSQGVPPISAWLWQFGSGFTSTLQYPTHTYIIPGDFAVTLTVSSISGTASVSDTIAAYPDATASFLYAPDSGPVPLTVYFTNSATYAISPTWDFGDGSAGAGDYVRHTYALSGTYNVTLTVQSRYGCGPDIAVGTVAAGCDAVNVLSVTTAISGCAVTFGADLFGTAPFVYLWDFGPFGTSSATNPLLDFQATGTYPVTLYVSNCSGVGYDAYPFEVHVQCGPAFSIYLPLLLKGSAR